MSEHYYLDKAPVPDPGEEFGTLDYADVRAVYEESVEAAQEAYDQARKTQRAMARALAQGLSATRLSRDLGIVRSRIYDLANKGKTQYAEERRAG